jgi:hypothetical protein
MGWAGCALILTGIAASLSQTDKLDLYELPKPDGGLFQSHPTISDTIVSRIAH